MKEQTNLNIRVPAELVKKAKQIKEIKGTNWSHEVRTFLERRVEELNSKPTTTAKAQ